MKAVKCIFEGELHELLADQLTYGKIYEVFHLQNGNYTESYHKNSVLIINDKDQQKLYYIEDYNGVWFVDATPYIREEKLKEIGI